MRRHLRLIEVDRPTNSLAANTNLPSAQIFTKQKEQDTAANQHTAHSVLVTAKIHAMLQISTTYVSACKMTSQKCHTF
jgi:hypothetical protein